MTWFSFIVYICHLFLLFVLSVFPSAFFSLLVFFNDTATTEIYTYVHTLSLHDALPISEFTEITEIKRIGIEGEYVVFQIKGRYGFNSMLVKRSEEHTSERQSLMRSAYAVVCVQKKQEYRNRTCLKYSN